MEPPIDAHTSEIDQSKSSQRHRKKSYYNAIRKQMEFYFGDANLSKDRFLRKLIQDDPYVPLETFLTFNKVKRLVKSQADIAKAIRKSEQLELNDDWTRVRRRLDIPDVYDADDRTIYVEQLPQDADHDWVIKVFSRYGSVSYVSLPKYKNSKKIKEFGFVEFETTNAVEKTLKAFDTFGGVLGYETAIPENLTSVTSFLKEQRKVVRATTSMSTSDDPDTDSSSSSTSSLQPPTKLAKVRCSVDTPASENLVTSTTATTTTTTTKKKKRKHRKKSKLMADLDQDNGVPDVTQMKIATKREWKRLRNKYLNLQREKASELKKHLTNSRGKQLHHYHHQQHSRVMTTTRLPIHRSPHNMNFYQDRDKDRSDKTDDKQTTTTIAAMESPKEKEFQTTVTIQAIKCDPPPSTLHYVSGLIVHIRMLKPCIDVKQFKAEMRQYSEVKYVDVREGVSEAHLRCESATTAQNLQKRIACAEYACQVLAGNAEKIYWQKIMQDRSDKLSKKVKIRSRRGREKVKHQLINHIRFDDEG